MITLPKKPHFTVSGTIHIRHRFFGNYSEAISIMLDGGNGERFACWLNDNLPAAEGYHGAAGEAYGPMRWVCLKDGSGIGSIRAGEDLDNFYALFRELGADFDSAFSKSIDHNKGEFSFSVPCELDEKTNPFFPDFL